jgi:hypothetical protein
MNIMVRKGSKFLAKSKAVSCGKFGQISYGANRHHSHHNGFVRRMDGEVKPYNPRSYFMGDHEKVFVVNHELLKIILRIMP